MPSFFKQKKNTETKDSQKQEDKNQQKKEEGPILASSSLAKNVADMKKKVGSSSDVIIREVKAGEQDEVHLAIIYIAGLVDNNTIHESLIEPLIQDQTIQNAHALKQILEKTLPLGGVKAEKSWDKLFTELMLGNALVLRTVLMRRLSAAPRGRAPFHTRAEHPGVIPGPAPRVYRVFANQYFHDSAIH